MSEQRQRKPEHLVDELTSSLGKDNLRKLDRIVADCVHNAHLSDPQQETLRDLFRGIQHETEMKR